MLCSGGYGPLSDRATQRWVLERASLLSPAGIATMQAPALHLEDGVIGLLAGQEPPAGGPKPHLCLDILGHFKVSQQQTGRSSQLPWQHRLIKVLHEKFLEWFVKWSYVNSE